MLCVLRAAEILNLPLEIRPVGYDALESRLLKLLENVFPMT
jgi:hypothetical protein